MSRLGRTPIWKRILRALAGRRTKSRPRHRRLGIEHFESRNLLAQVTLTPAADNSMFSESPGFSDGIGQYLYSGDTFVGVRRALVKFDVSSAVPQGAHIDSVTLQLHVSRDSPGADSNYEVHRVTANWGEGTSNSDAFDKGGRGTTATTNDATWHFRFFNTSTWTTDGGDFSSSDSAST